MSVKVIEGDCREVLAGMAAESVQCCITSPPYFGLRDYKSAPLVWPSFAEATEGKDCEHEWGDEGTSGQRQRSGAAGGIHEGRASNKLAENITLNPGTGQFCRRCRAWRGQLGLEPTPDLYLAHLVECFRAVKRVLRDDGTLWLNMGDAYACAPNGRSAAATKAAGRDDRTFRDKPFSTVGGEIKAKDLMLMPFEVAKALRGDGWWLRSCLPWVKPNPMPDSAKDRPGAGIEWWFLLTKSARCFYDHVAVCREAVALNDHDFTGTGYEAPGQPPQTGNRPDKQRGHSRRHAGFNDRWDQMTKAEQQGFGRNFRNADLFYESLGPPHGLISGGQGEPLAFDFATEPFPEAHFATFPTKLIVPMVKAGTSEKGCCPECRSPWVREIEAVYRGGNRIDRTLEKGATRNRLGGQAEWDAYEPAKTTGWHPSCKCAQLVDGDKGWEECAKTLALEPVPCTVLDPFAGAGTVGLVADRLGRDAILIDSKAEYCDMALKRLEADAGLFAEVSG